jgi:polyhydroxyalkanoate synthesis repressor PhaR
MSTELHVIKKYPNRRLYDTEISSYITLEDVRQLVLKEVPIQVVDARTKEDITYTTLLQIIMESEEKGPSFFSTDILQKMIRFYGGSMQQMLKMMLEQWGKMSGVQGTPNFPNMSNMPNMPHMQDPISQWQNWQKQWMNAWMSQMGGKTPSSDKDDDNKPH